MEGVNLALANSLSNFRPVGFYDYNINKFDIDNNEPEQWDALLRFHFKINPNELADDEYFKMAAQLKWVIEQENKKYQSD
ncbi:hypothetical protein [uncultured Mediterranean phage uvMED]|nr:hypothetical protein [uncultured Mediterranean phage uvMED]BAR22575.1 hypothetical protein [uncultured Mediterranean phage uvMED]